MNYKYEESYNSVFIINKKSIILLLNHKNLIRYKHCTVINQKLGGYDILSLCFFAIESHLNLIKCHMRGKNNNLSI